MLTSVLLVDDDEITNFINRGVISKLRIAEEIHIAYNGQEGINTVLKVCQEKESCPELIFLDLKMPGSDGFDFLTSYMGKQFIHKELTIITVLTTSAHPSDMEKVLELGANEILQKPLTKEKVLEVYNKYFQHS